MTNENSNPASEQEATGLSKTPETKNTPERQLGEFFKERHHVNFGGNALIYRMEASEVPLELKGAESEPANDAALKLLKVYYKGRADKEFENQSLAYRIMSQVPEGQRSNYALVPKAWTWKTVVLDEEARQSLNSEGASIIGNQAEVIVMDFIEGEDLATIFYRWIIEHAPADKEYIKLNVHPNDIDQLQTAVAAILEFEKSSNKHTDEQTRQSEERRLQKMNARKVYSFLKKTGFRLNPRVVEQIKNTLRLFEQNHFYHNDEHERNFMVTGAYQGEGEVQTYIIDFDKATTHQLEGSGFRIDQVLSELLEEKGNKEREELVESALLRSRDQAWIHSHSSWMNANPDVAEKRLKMIMYNAGSSEQSLTDFVALSMKLVEQGKLNNGQVAKLLDELKASMVIHTPKARQKTRIVNPNIYRRVEVFKSIFN
jgi:hypothetical protein